MREGFAPKSPPVGHSPIVMQGGSPVSSGTKVAKPNNPGGVSMSFMRRQGLLAGLILFGMISISPLQGSESPYTSAEECKTCHPSIYKYWSESTHAKAVQGELFPVTLGRALELSKDQARTKKECVGCHSPTTLVTSDFGLQQAVSRQGVTCDFCHTVKDVD